MELNNSTIEKPRRTRTMTEAALAANRENAKKSTGPRTAAGKARSASNNFRHGLYRLEAYSQFATSHDLALAVAHNFLEDLAPVTPLEHTYVHAIISLELRHLQLETLYNQTLTAISMGEDRKYFPVLMRELSQFPTRLDKMVKAYRAEVAQRLSQEVAPIEDFPPLPAPHMELHPEPEPNQNLDSNPNPQPNPTSSYINKMLHYLSLHYGETPTAIPFEDSNPNPLPMEKFE